MQALMIGQSSNYRESGPSITANRHFPCPGYLRDARRHPGRLLPLCLRLCFVPESLALLLAVIAAWFYAC